MKINLIVIILLSLINLLMAKDNFKIIENLKYGISEKNSLDMYIPKNNLNKKVIFMVHGGAWRFGDKSSKTVVKNKVKYWVSRGYVFVSTNYSLSSNIDVYEQASEVARALTYSQNYLGKYGIKSKDFVLMGHSAGAHLVSLLTSNTKIAYEEGAKLWSSTISIDNAAFNISKIMNNKHQRLYDKAFGKDKLFWQKVSPFYQLKGKIVPFLAICSTKRKSSCEDSEEYIKKAKSFGSSASILKIDYNHKRTNKKLGLNNSYTKQVDRFILENLNK